MVSSYRVDFLHDVQALLAYVWEQELEADGLTKPLAHESEELLDPAHQVVEQALALGVNLVNKRIERLFVPLYEVNEDLNRLCRILLANCASEPWKRVSFPGEGSRGQGTLTFFSLFNGPNQVIDKVLEVSQRVRNTRGTVNLCKRRVEDRDYVLE